MNKSLIVGALVLAATLQPAFAAGDPVAGEAIFKKCATCHSIGEGARNKIGPELNDVFGRVAGSVEGYKYSQALIDAGTAGLTWTPQTIVPWLHKPKDVVSGTKMSFVGLADQTDIDNVIAYLATFSPDYMAAVPAADASSSTAQ